MSNETSMPNTYLVDLTAKIVSAYVSENHVQAAELPALIASTYASLAKLDAPAEPEPARPEPPVPVRKTVTPDHIISLEDGKPYKSLKRHLSTRGLTPEQYRQKWSLPHDYPMVAANYAAERSEIAKNAGLGRRRGEARAKPDLVDQAA